MSPPPDTFENEFTPQERRILLSIAHAAVEAALANRELSLESASLHLAEPRGAFTTLHVRGQLRGCVGYALAVTPLHQTVAETARAAAIDDRRFPPLTRDELAELSVSLSILSLLKEVKAEEVEIGRHGLLISQHGQRGLLLPQVAVEHGWNRRTFLDQTCRKAGLPDTAWKEGAKIEGFTAEVFGEEA